MRKLALLLPVLACASQKSADKPTPDTRKGVELSDIDRSAAPCDDFFQYANGAWRKANPIPSSMQRWSRRWEAGETNKERLKDILDEVSRRSDWPKGSVEQIVGDHYAACMDEARIDARGIEPLKPLLAQIDSISAPADVQRAIRRLHDLAVFAAFGVGAQPDQHQAVIGVPRTGRHFGVD